MTKLFPHILASLINTFKIGMKFLLFIILDILKSTLLASHGLNCKKWNPKRKKTRCIMRILTGNLSASWKWLFNLRIATFM